jgi:RNA polymerase sigma-70 factor (ECF subfamily)
VSSLRSHRAARTSLDDAALLRAVHEGDLGALGEVYDRHAKHVWHAVRRTLGHGADVEDVVHATFLRLPELAASFDGRPSCRAWLCGIAIRLALRHKRGVGRFQRMLRAFAEGLTGHAARSAGDPERQASDGEELAAFEAALALLSEKKRAVLVLVELEGVTAEEAARLLGIPAATARTRLFHARAELREAMGRGREGGEP